MEDYYMQKLEMLGSEVEAGIMEHLEVLKEFAGLFDDKEELITALKTMTKDFLEEDLRGKAEMHNVDNPTAAPANPGDYTKTPLWQQLEKAAADICGRQTHGITQAEAPNLNDTSMREDLMVCDTSFRVPIDPITKKPIENPCVNSACGHVYEYAVIKELYKAKKRGIRVVNKACPYVGCVHEVDLKNIQVDDAMRTMIASSQRSASQGGSASATVVMDETL